MNSSQETIAAALRAAKAPAVRNSANVVPLHMASRAIRGMDQQDGMPFHGGLLHSPVPGRTDRLNVNVPNGSYVLPADIVSGLGQGNTIAGARTLDRVFSGAQPYGGKGGPYGAMALPGAKGHGPGRPHFARGGMVPIVAAGGEYVVPPHVVEALGNGDMKRGHDLLDQFVKTIRAKTVKTTRKLPPPKKK